LRWKKNLEDAWSELDLKLIFKVGIVEPMKWIGEKIGTYQRNMMEELQGEKGAAKGQRHRDFWMGLGEAIGDLQRSGFKDAHGEYQTGGMVSKTGMYKLHTGETVTMQGSSPSGANEGPTEINIDFSGTNIHLASGIELDQFADAISNKIAERQHSKTY
jgi:hypothetical protein